MSNPSLDVLAIPVARLAKGRDDTRLPWAHVLGDPFDDPVPAGAISPFNDDQKLLPALQSSSLQLHELDCRMVEQIRASMLTEINANLGSTKAFIVILRSAHSLLPDHANSRVGSPLAPGALATKRRPMLAGSRNRSGGRRSRELS